MNEPAERTRWLHPSPVGPLLVTCSPDGVRAIELSPGHPDPVTPEAGSGRRDGMVAAALDAYFGGELTAVQALPVDLAGCRPFQRAVLAALREVPPGATVTYGELARAVGRPASARAVGQAVGANPVPVVVPCHRVVAGDGSLGGYSGGLERKRWLLAHERAPARAGGWASRRAPVAASG